MTLTSTVSREQAPDRRPRVVLVDDHQLLTQSLAVALEMEGLACSVAPLQDRASLLRTVVELSPDLVLLDLDLGGDLGDGSLIVAPLVRDGFRVLVVSGSVDQDQIGRSLENGAVGVLDKAATFTVLLDTVVAAARGQEVLDPTRRRHLVQKTRDRRACQTEAMAPFERLSAREAEVLRALGQGLSVVAIAQAGFVSEATVRSQVRAVLTKLGVTSQLQAVALANRCGWLLHR